jgi:hypothetical protein
VKVRDADGAIWEQQPEGYWRSGDASCWTVDEIDQLWGPVEEVTE